MTDSSKETDDEMLQDLQMLPKGGKEVCTTLLNITILLYFEEKYQMK